MIDEDTKAKFAKVIEMVGNISKELKKGLSESDYKNALLMELQENGIHYTTEETVTITYKGIGIGYKRIDICLTSWLPLIIELKAVSSEIKPDNLWQVLNYMITKKMPYGVVINFCQSPSRPISYRFVILDGLIPYVYNELTETKTILEGHCF